MQCLKPVYLPEHGLTVPCGRCRMCKVRRADEWALRCVHELSDGVPAVFATLTFDDAHLPSDGSLSKRTLQLFLKRLRKGMEPRKVRYLACGEYGSRERRPHYHAVLFGVSLEDHELELVSRWSVEKGWKCFGGPVKDAWPFGFVVLGTVTHQSARYVMEYLHKAYAGDYVKEVYGDLVQPFRLQSQGLGRKYVDEFEERLVSDLAVRVRGESVGLPRYYAARLQERYPELRPRLQEKAAVVKDEAILRRCKHNGVCIEDAVVGIARSNLQAARTRLARIDLKAARL